MPRLAIIINPRGGTLAREGAPLLDALKAHDSVQQVETLEGDAAKALSAIKLDRVDALAIAGGDGTIRAVTAAAMEARCPLPLLPLPLGTANLLPRALYGDRDALSLLDEADGFERHDLTAGALDGHLFLIAAAIGFPTALARARESLRDEDRRHKLAGAMRNAIASLGQAFRPRLTCRFDDRPAKGRASGLYVTLATDPLHETIAPDPETADQQGEATSFAAVLTRWRHIGDMAAAPVDTLTRTENPDARTRPIAFNVAEIRSRKPLAAMIDGEPLTLGRHARIARLPDPVTVLKPSE
ncbi:diacylglycerol/lipid kinase family protein [Maricaulis maris]|uniref:Diacylglycerol kinase family enzyme n=1 Tax=Maricaulis maris TaxID=74318 RepID=A0A495D0Z5_9PROT|nr:diacylglycerol kinase family protein [Maricaulis maris]RKQ95202.1 diacylglycerol kinase family enzyme [Maricaulis maris]